MTAPSPVARLAGLSYCYPDGGPALREVDLDLGAGLTVVAGPSGGGKSTLLRVLNGLVPHFHGGVISGTASVLGLDVMTTPARRLARHVGFVFQDPELQSVYGSVAREVAFALENTATPPAAIEARVDAALNLAGLAGLGDRSLSSLSGGERQRVAIASALALGPELLVLDEPSSQLDLDGARQLAATCRRLAAEGRAVVIAEHRLDWLLGEQTGVVLVEGGRVGGPGPAAEMAARLPTVPALVELGLHLGWRPLPLSVAAARAFAPALRKLEARPLRSQLAWSLSAVSLAASPRGEAVIESADLSGSVGEVLVLIGPNGGGKTTLLRALAGLVRPRAGSIHREVRGRIAYLPQNPGALLHRRSVRAEVATTLQRAGDPAPADELLAELGLSAIADRYPRDLSSGQRQRAALAAILAGSPGLVLLDEPTRGMDGPARVGLLRLLSRLRERGCSVVMATHDLDLAAEAADRVVLVRSGRVRVLGPPDAALSGDGPHSTQIGQLYPGGPVTVSGVLSRLGPR